QRGVHPRAHPRGARDRGGGARRSALVRAGRARGGALRVIRGRALGTAALLAVLGGHAAAQEPEATVARVEGAGNQYLQRETLLYYVSTKPGDRYDEQRLKADFRRLWDTGFLDDLTLDVRDSPEGKLITFRVAERKRIQIVDYRGSKELTNSNIEDE